jgi:hypothetical protein
MSPIQSPPDPFTKLLYSIYYGAKSVWYSIFKPNKQINK